MGGSLCRLAAGTCLPKSGRGEILNLERLGIAQSVMPELSPAAVYRVGETVVKGEADIALHQIPELMAVPSIEIVGPLPSDLHSITAFSAAVLATGKEAEAAKTLVEFLRSPGTAAGLRAKGFEM